MNETLNQETLPSTPDQAHEVFCLIATIDEDERSLDPIVLSTENIPQAIKAHFKDKYIGGLLDDESTFETFDTRREAAKVAFVGVNTNGDGAVSAFNEATTTYQLAVSNFLNEREVTPELARLLDIAVPGYDEPVRRGSFEMAALITITRSQNSNILPVDASQEYQYEIWQGDGGEYFIHVDDEEAQKLHLDPNERGMEQWRAKRIPKLQAIIQAEDVDDDVTSMEEILERMRADESTGIYETKLQSSEDRELEALSDMISERMEGWGVVSSSEADALISLLRGVASE